MAQADMTPTQKFIDTLTRTPSLATELQNNLQRLKDDNQRIIEYLTYAKTVSDDLTRLHDNLTTASELLAVASVVPEIGEEAAALKRTVDALNREVAPAQKAAARIESLVKPLREALQKLDPVLAKGIETTKNIASVSGDFLETFTDVSDCIDNLPDGSPKELGQEYLNHFSTQFQPDVEALNKALEAANSAIETFYAKLQELCDKLEPLAAIAKAIDQVLDVLNPIMLPLEELKRALMSIKLTLPLPYPVSVSLYDILTKFGAFADLAMKPIQDLVGELQKLLHIHLPQIPGLGDLINLNIDIPDIPDFSELIGSIYIPFEKLGIGIHLFHLDCPPKETHTAFMTQLEAHLRDVGPYFKDGGSYRLTTGNKFCLTVFENKVVPSKMPVDDCSCFTVGVDVTRKITLRTASGRYLEYADGTFGVGGFTPCEECFFAVEPKGDMSFALRRPGNRYVEYNGDFALTAIPVKKTS